MASRKSQEHSHAESLAMSAATAIVEDETRQGSPPSLSNRSKKEESLEKLDYGANLRHGGQPNAAAASSNIWANSDDSDAHWYGNSNNTHTAKTNTNTENIITNSMGNLSLSSKDYGKDGRRGGGNTSVASATSSIPGIVGISSGSTGGNTAHSSWNDATSYSQYSMTHQQQQRQQPLHIPSVPPGFLSPLVASKNDDESSTSRSFTTLLASTSTIFALSISCLSLISFPSSVFGQSGRIRTCVYPAPNRDDNPTFVTLCYIHYSL